MDGIDTQILDYLSDLPSDIDFIISPHADEFFNMPPLNISPNEIIERIEKLNIDGYLQDFNEGKSGSEHERILALTKKGGCEWERVFKPNWLKYVLVESDLVEDKYEHYSISSLNKEKLMRIIHDINNKLIDGYVLNKVSPWDATYWKSFNEGYKLECMVKDSIDHYLINIQENWRLPPLSL